MSTFSWFRVHAHLPRSFTSPHLTWHSPDGWNVAGERRHEIFPPGRAMESWGQIHESGLSLRASVSVYWRIRPKKWPMCLRATAGPYLPVMIVEEQVCGRLAEMMSPGTSEFSTLN